MQDMEVRYNPKTGLYDFPNKIRTVTGKYIDLLDITPDDIDIEDIAYGLAHTARFAGQTRTFYSVLEHSIAVSMEVPHKFKLEALLHDASEAYIGDMPTPIKNRMPDYKYVESCIMDAVAKKFGISWPLSEVVKAADKKILEQEWDLIVIGDDWQDETPVKNVINGYLTLFQYLNENER
jgi:hypothetical protein